jgi:hypothetical protein
MKNNRDKPIPVSWLGMTHQQKDFGEMATQLAVMYSSVIWFRSSRTGACYGQATGFLLNTGTRSMLVTNAHVIHDGYQRLNQEHGDVQFVFGGRQIDPRIIDLDDREGIDVATLDVNGITFEQNAPGYWGSNASRLTPVATPTWPERAPSQGLATMIVGWPGKFRVANLGTPPQFAAFPLAGNLIDDVRENSFLIPFERSALISSDYDPNNRVVDETDFGGISGTPVFALHRGGLRPLELVGIVRAYGEGFDVLYCTRADIIDAHGRINPR